MQSTISAAIMKVCKALRMHAGKLVLLAICMLLLPTSAKAQTGCFYEQGGQTAVNYSPPATLSPNLNAPVGAILWQSDGSPSNPPVVNCFGTVTYGIVNNVGSTPGTSVLLYPTGVSGLAFQLTHDSGDTTSGPMKPWPCCSQNSGSGGTSSTYSIGTTLALVKTGPITSGSVLPAGVLAYWQWQGGGFGADLQVEAFRLTNSVTITEAGCTVNTTPISVTLPTLSTTALGANGSTAGTTAFNIALTCPGTASGVTLSVQLDFNGTASGVTGVLTPTSGTSKGVSVRLLDQNSNPVTFGTSQAVGTTPSGQMTIPYYAQYYRTGALTPGSLTASATFTLSYK